MMPRTLPAVKRRSGKSAADRKLSIDKDILKFFPEPHRMGLPAPSHWEKPSLPDRNRREIIQNSY